MHEKFRYSEKATEFWKNLPIFLYYLRLTSVKTILWPSQNIWTLIALLFFCRPFLFTMQCASVFFFRQHCGFCAVHTCFSRINDGTKLIKNCKCIRRRKLRRAVHKLCCLGRGVRVKNWWVYLGKRRQSGGGGVKNDRFWDDIVMDGPILHLGFYRIDQFMQV